MKRLFFYVYLYMLGMFLAVNFGIAPVFDRAIQEYFQGQTGPYWRDMIRGPYHLIESELERLPVGQWNQAVVDLQRHFAFPIAIKTLEAGQRPGAEALALRRGEIVVHGAGESFQHQIGQSGLILSMGPMPKIESSIPDFKFKVRMLQLLFCMVVVVSFFGFALVWVLPFAKNLNRISSAAAAFGQGALDARVKVRKRSSLAPLAGAFNRMADRIQDLIASHRELTHTVSHELRTPLARMRFNLEMIASAIEPIEREKHHDEIRRNVDELDMLVSELLTYARFDRENYQPEKDALDMGPWLKELTAAWNDENETIRVDCRIDSPDARVPAKVNPRLLERAVRNLLQNAARYASQRIHVTLETADDHCLIHVDDDGPGVAETDHQKIFEPFVRLNLAEENEAHGYGLGLAIVRRVARWHGGQAMVGGAPIGGARFTLRWPNPLQKTGTPAVPTE